MWMCSDPNSPFAPFFGILPIETIFALSGVRTGCAITQHILCVSLDTVTDRIFFAFDGQAQYAICVISCFGMEIMYVAIVSAFS